MRKLYEKSSKLVAGCSTIKDKPFWRTGKYAAPCSYTSMKALISDDYTRTGKCNYYMTGDVMHHMNLAMAFQVLIISVSKAKYSSNRKLIVIVPIFLLDTLFYTGPSSSLMFIIAILEGKPIHSRCE